jgi:hypothetical protein
MAISDFLTPEQANLLLDQQFSSPQGIARLNPLAFKYKNAMYPYEDFIGSYSQIDPNAPMYEDFSKPQPDFINAPQNDYASLYSLPELDTSRFKGTNLESGYLDRAGSYGQDVYSEKPKGGGIGDLFKFLLGLAVPGAGLIMNLGQGGFNKLRGGFDKGLGALRNINQRIQNTDFGQSRTLQEYMMKRRERKQAERAQEAMPEVYRSAREQGFTNDRGGFSTNRADRAGTSVGSGQFSPSTSRGRSGY